MINFHYIVYFLSSWIGASIALFGLFSSVIFYAVLIIWIHENYFLGKNTDYFDYFHKDIFSKW